MVLFEIYRIRYLKKILAKKFSTITCSIAGKAYGAIPLNFVDAERSFSKMKLLMAAEKSSMTMDNFNMFAIFIFQR